MHDKMSEIEEYTVVTFLKKITTKEVHMSGYLKYDLITLGDFVLKINLLLNHYFTVLHIPSIIGKMDNRELKLQNVV